MKCWRCQAGVSACQDGCRSQGVGAFTSVASRSALAVQSGGRAKAPSFESLVRPVQNGPLSQRLEPAKASLVTGVNGYGHGVGDAKSIYYSVPLAWPTDAGLAIVKAAGLGGQAAKVVRSFIDPVGAILFGGGIFGSGFLDDSAERKKKNMAMYQLSWGQAKATVVDQITAAQRKLDMVDRDMIALGRTMDGLDGTVRANGSPPASVASAVSVAKQKRDAAVAAVEVLQATEDNLNAASAKVATGEQSGSTGPGSDAQQALEKAAQTAAGVDGQITSVNRAVNAAIQYARAATNAVNRWVDQVQVQAQLAQKHAADAALLAAVASRLQAPPQGWTWDANGNLVPVVGPTAGPQQLMTPYFASSTG